MNNLYSFIKSIILIPLLYSLSFSDQLPFKLIDTIGKIQIGYSKTYSKDSDVIKCYGPGYYNKMEGHGGAIYYLDSSLKTTFRFEIGVDGVIDMVEILSGNNIPDSSHSDPHKFITSGLSRNIYMPYHLTFGQSPSQVIKLIGKPATDSTTQNRRIFIYNLPQEILIKFQMMYYEAKFVFEGNKFIDISVYYGE